MCCAAKIWMFTCGGIFGVLGIILAIFWPTWSVDIMYSIMPLAPNSFLYNYWAETPVPLYMTFYLYNWSNPDQIANPNIKPHFTEHGPYVFLDKKEKIIHDWNNEDSTVTYEDHRFWYFEPELSGGSADDIIVAPHFPSVSVSKLSRDFSDIVRKIANFTLEREGGALTMQATAMEWLFDSFYDDIFDFVYRLHSPLLPINSSNFAYFMNRNGSTGAEGNFTIHTGKKDIHQLADIKLWRGKSRTKLWDDDCGKINGSTGELYSPGKSWSDVTTILIPEVQRFINLFPKSEVNYKGIKAWRYESTDQTFDSGYVAPDTKCFCARNKPCPAPGAIDFSPALFGAPVYVSHPHFFLSDPSYLENITGLQPDPEKHVSFLIIEPVVAVPLKAVGQAFVTILVERDEAIDLFKDVAHNFYAPLLRVAITAEITDDLMGLAKLAAYTPAIGQILGIIFAVGGAIVLIIAIVFTLTNRWDKGVQSQPLENEAGENSTILDSQISSEGVTEVNEISSPSVNEQINGTSEPANTTGETSKQMIQDSAAGNIKDNSNESSTTSKDKNESVELPAATATDNVISQKDTNEIEKDAVNSTQITKNQNDNNVAQL